MNDAPLFESLLLLEDDAAHAMLITRALKGLAGTLHHVTTKKEALQKLGELESLPSIIISDLNVPDGKELEIVEPLLLKAPGVPLVVLTSSTSLTTAIAAMKVGARDYIIKNFGPDFKDTLALALQRVALSIIHQKERQRLEREMAILRLAVENSTDGVALVTDQGEITYHNTSFSELLEKLRGAGTTHVDSLFSGLPSADKVLLSLKEALTHAEVWTSVLESPKEIGVTYQIELSRLSPASAKPTVSALWLRDITDMKRRERFQKEMLSTTTHDLKGPLGAILISTELITAKPDDSKRVTDITLRIASAAQGAVNIIDEFLSARRIQEGTFILKPKPGSVRALAEEVQNQFGPLVKAKSLDFSVQTEPDFQASFDKLGMIRVLGNLLSNAVKFTPKQGSIALIFSCDTSNYTITIRDTGNGMEPQEAKKLFERYSRLSRHEEVEGTGLGLFVVKSIVEAHGGKISITSSVGVGTTFELSLPLEPPINSQGELYVMDFAA